MTLPSSLVPIAAAIEAKSLVLTESGRAAAWLRAMLGCSANADECGGVSSWRDWTRSLWSRLLLEGLDDRVLLNRWQEEHLWTQALQDAVATEGGELPASSARDLAPVARQAVTQVFQMRLQHRLGTEADTYDSRILARAFASLQGRCAQERLLLPAQLDEALAQLLKVKVCLELPTELVLAGAWETSPAQKRLLERLERNNVSISRRPIESDRSGKRFRWWTSTADVASTYEVAVKFAAQQAHRGAAHHIALVVQDPASCRLELESLFRKHLAPELGSITEDLSSTPWAFAVQTPLSAMPMVRNALEVLRWSIAPASIASICGLIRSPYFAGEDTVEFRARWAAALTAEPMWRPSLALTDFLKLSRTLVDPALLSAWEDFAGAVESAAGSGALRPVTQWVAYARRLLQTTEWPGARSLSAAEYAAVQRWEHLLDGLATLQLLEARCSFAAFLSLLTREAGHPREAPHGGTSPLQVLTEKDAEDQLFDLVIVLDVESAERKNLNPLLPLAMQRSLTGSEQEQQEQDIAATPLQKLIHCCEAILLVQTNEEDAEASLSPWATASGFTLQDPATLLLPIPEPTPLLLEPVQEAAALPFLFTEEAFGGTQVLELQAACGFRAFASLRLRAGAPEGQELGIDARAAGNVLHDALRHFWTRVRSRSNLAAMIEAERENAVTDAVRAALSSTADRDQWERQYRTILQRRYTRLMHLWLQEELHRGPFEVVLQEQPRELMLGPLRLSLRPDRVDRIEDGVVFVDYKSSRDLAVRYWEGERPDAPQLPAYALTESEVPVRAIAFAQVRPAQKQRRWIGLADADGILPITGKTAARADFQVRLEDWRRDLTALAEAFVSGDVRVQPKEYPHTCRYCAQRPLCRIDPTTLKNTDEHVVGSTESNHG